VSENLLHEIWQRRSLILLLSFNDIKIRYRNSVLGFFWSFLEPLLMLTVLYVVFTNVIKTNIENYPLYLLLGLIMWYMFSRATSMGLTSLAEKSAITQQVYFRKELIVISSALTSFIMMAFEFSAFAVFVVALQFIPPLTIIILPLLLLDLFVLSLGLAFLLSVLNVYFRDIKFIWQILLQIGFFASPIIYTLDLFPPNIRVILELNPMVPILESAHGAVLYGYLPSLTQSITMIGSTVVIFTVGFLIFRYKQKKIIEDL